MQNTQEKTEQTFDNSNTVIVMQPTIVLLAILKPEFVDKEFSKKVVSAHAIIDDDDPAKDVHYVKIKI